MNGCSKLIKTSQTLQIIQSRLAFKQQLYADALLRNNNQTGAGSSRLANNLNELDDNDLNGGDDNDDDTATMVTAANDFDRRSLYSSYGGRRRSEEDNDSFVSAESVSYIKLFYRLTNVLLILSFYNDDLLL
jgi:hypothetical protein